MTQRPTTGSGATPYRRRRPERTLLYRTVQTHLETWLALRRGDFDDADVVAGDVAREFRRYLECGILAHGFARARCAQCGHDFLIAFSCKGRGVCPSCNTRRMVETAAHLADHVLPPLPVRQWVLAVPKRLRYFLERDAALQGAAPVPGRGGAVPARAQPGFRPLRADRRGRLHSPLRLRAQRPPALSLRRDRRRVRAHGYRGRGLPSGHRARRAGHRRGASEGASPTLGELRAPRSAGGGPRSTGHDRSMAAAQIGSRSKRDPEAAGPEVRFESDSPIGNPRVQPGSSASRALGESCRPRPAPAAPARPTPGPALAPSRRAIGLPRLCARPIP